jgi:hypothetical protein
LGIGSFLVPCVISHTAVNSSWCFPTRGHAHLQAKLELGSPGFFWTGLADHILAVWSSMSLLSLGRLGSQSCSLFLPSCCSCEPHFSWEGWYYDLSLRLATCSVVLPLSLPLALTLHPGVHKLCRRQSFPQTAVVELKRRTPLLMRCTNQCTD